jgi:hypothetical protein
VETRGEELARIGGLFEKGMLKATEDSVWRLEEFKGAFGKTASGYARGKVEFIVLDES